MSKPKFRPCAVGDRYGRLRVVELIAMPKNPRARCLCDCGQEVTRQRGALVRGVATSCGCVMKEKSPLLALLEAIKIETDDCIETPTCRLPLGYGVIRFDGRNERAHRVAYAFANGLAMADLTGVHVLHQCDNPPCVNPRHLKAGTHLDNMHDMFAKGRRQAAIGERASKAKLNAGQVIEIRRRAAAGEKDRPLAAAFGIGETSIRAIRLGKSWRHV